MSTGINLLNFSDPKIKTLHITWFAFFLTFALWFSHAPLLVSIKEALDLSSAQIKALLILNVALTIPARIVIGILVDKYGPRKTFSSLLLISSFISFGFAFADNFEQLALFRFLLGFVGAGFVIGIRMVGEWFPAKQVGVAEGIYGGWGNFGSAAAAMTLPTLALLYGGDNGWRYALASIGTIAGLYGVFYFFVAQNTPKGSTYFKPKKAGGLEVTSWKDFYFYILMNVPMYIALAVLSWKLSPAGVKLLSSETMYMLWAVLAVLFFIQFRAIWQVNKEHLQAGVPELEKYSFKQVAILDVSYFITFGSELAVVSMLPLFFIETFEGLDPVKAGLLASGFAFMNLVSRPTGGWFSDKLGRRKSLMFLIAGLALGYYILSTVDSSWAIPLAVLATMACSFFVQAGEGAVFAIVPLIKRRMTGQIAGMAGAYGNVGGVTYLTILSFVDYSTFFLVIAASAVFGFFIAMMLDEPKGQMAETMPDGTVHLINVE
ncbi:MULTISPECIES: NarK family nitrate/nitrite MFS transporter [unclassified Pseudoalteromonas]|uniref:NarK family nitrate/nitrite MFS transporter n=1 Tax=unclassified Pseudoalteromonas TaxID=194690 RepID=UPI000CF62793|nr:MULTISPECIES: NarK family nitrate/nitrite MFS transporter [unclassified Pseudoalteromonas]MBS3798035.1 NarK family nitrate/nitrite MFS transporter [Pseudoalteromonas sp. BDTF-M6]